MLTLSLENQISIIGIISAFIGIAIMLGLGITILSNTSMDCSGLTGYNSEDPSASTGWGGSCFHVNEQTANSYSLLLVILIIVAAAAILFVVKLL